MHEPAHIQLRHPPARVEVSDTGLLLLSDYSDEQEQEADWLGAALLLPREGLVRLRPAHKSADEIAIHYGVSERLCQWRLRMTGVHTQMRRAYRRCRSFTGARFACAEVVRVPPNRILLQDRLSELVKSAQRAKTKVAVIFIDLDRFKDVNDFLGHGAGDLLLQTLAKRLCSAVRDQDTVARMGGDEFVLLIQGLQDVKDVPMFAQKLLTCLIKPVTLNGYEITVTASMGISLYPEDAANGPELIRNADAAMYKAKDAGRNAYRFHTSDLNQRALEMLSMENSLRRAVERREFVLHYQPQVDIKSGSVVGAEALIRWNHPDLGLLMPGKFIPIAEERGLIVPIGGWVIEEAARQAVIWHNSGISMPIAVNVSAVQFRQKDFVEELANSVRKHGITPDGLELELTEGIIMRDAETTIKVLEKLHDIGFQLSIDDFGTGYSSLSYLRRFPIDKIKIDQSFIRAATHDEGAAGIVTAIIALARSLKLKVIAEGVETGEQLEILRAQGCDEAQGFLFSGGVGPEEFQKLVGEWKPQPPRIREFLPV